MKFCTILQLESLRAALANRGPKSPLMNKPNEVVVQTPREKKPKPMTEKTPPRTRRLSIENCSSAVKAEKNNGAKTPYTQAKSRRLSLEGPRYANKTPEKIKLTDSVRTPTNGGSKVEQNQPRQPPRSPMGKTDKVGGLFRDLNHHRPRATPKKLLEEKSDDSSRTRIPRLQQPKTPEPVVKYRKGMKSEHDDGSQSEVFPTPSGLANNSSSTQGKGGSHIRKSIRSIGKFINGSEKRYNISIISIFACLHACMMSTCLVVPYIYIYI